MFPRLVEDEADPLSLVPEKRGHAETALSFCSQECTLIFALHPAHSRVDLPVAVCLEAAH